MTPLVDFLRRKPISELRLLRSDLRREQEDEKAHLRVLHQDMFLIDTAIAKRTHKRRPRKS